MKLKNYETICFLDIETSGISLNKDKIIELAIIKTEDGKEIDRYEKLFNPRTHVSDFILSLTGISQTELKEACLFEEEANQILNFLDNSLIVAHNARFDIGFLKTEFKNLNFQFNNDYCCTVRLSRSLFPEHRKHNLDSIIERFAYKEGDRHRAMFDTEVIKNFYFDTQKMFDDITHKEAVHKAITQPHIPGELTKFKWGTFPESPGVYRFIGENFPLYIGKSNNIKRRVLDHLYSSTSSSKESKISQQIKKIETIPTVGVLGAEIREAILIKKEMPLYNHKLRRNSAMSIIKRQKNYAGYYTLTIGQEIGTILEEDVENLIELAPSIKTSKFILDGIAKKHRLCPALLGLEKHKGACFSYQLGMCNGACTGTIDAQEYNDLFTKAFENYSVMDWPYESGIILKEENENDFEEFLVYKWFLLGSTKDDIRKILNENKYFDRDIYKTLKRHITNPSNIKIIEVDISNFDSSQFHLE